MAEMDLLGHHPRVHVPHHIASSNEGVHLQIITRSPHLHHHLLEAGESRAFSLNSLLIHLTMILLQVMIKQQNKLSSSANTKSFFITANLIQSSRFSLVRTCLVGLPGLITMIALMSDLSLAAWYGLSNSTTSRVQFLSSSR